MEDESLTENEFLKMALDHVAGLPPDCLKPAIKFDWPTAPTLRQMLDAIYPFTVTME